MRVERISQLEIGTDEVNGGERLIVGYTNYGEPYREGCEVSLSMKMDGWDEPRASVFLNSYEAAELRDWLLRFVPLPQPPKAAT